MSKIIWNNDWNTNINQVDIQHKQLISLMNKIIDDEIKSEKLITEFIEYTAYHFADEEKLMIENDYPYDEFEKHRKEHRKFTEALFDVSFKIFETDHDSESELIVAKFKSFCLIWFENHFLKTDGKMSEFVRNVGVNNNK